MEITKKQFMAYENVRTSGVTNMFAVDIVCCLSGLDRDQCVEIMGSYDSLKEKYLTKQGA